MALQASSLMGVRCSSCRQWVLRSFIASLGGQTAVHSRPAFQQYRSFSRALTLRDNSSNIRQDRHADHLHELNDALSTPAKAPYEQQPGPETANDQAQEEAKPQSTEYIPWYLQSENQPSTKSVSPVAARQQLPDLPSHSPQLLQPLLEQVSVDLGMDDLTLLDLRALDPPPALGANLLMIIGTARSEKHLHVSADRLCRWLRSTYDLNPYADGLLGRQELKVKMRRRLKRSRLMSAVGAKATSESEMEEGLRTGWVCVNVGRVEGGELPDDEQKVQRMEGMVGFGARFEGCNIVVQMMTEEKRQEIDLEKLWNGIMRRAHREDSNAQALENELEAGLTSTEGSSANIESRAHIPHHAAHEPQDIRA